MPCLLTSCNTLFPVKGRSDPPLLLVNLANRLWLASLALASNPNPSIGVGQKWLRLALLAYVLLALGPLMGKRTNEVKRAPRPPGGGASLLIFRWRRSSFEDSGSLTGLIYSFYNELSLSRGRDIKENPRVPRTVPGDGASS